MCLPKDMAQETHLFCLWYSKQKAKEFSWGGKTYGQEHSHNQRG